MNCDTLQVVLLVVSTLAACAAAIFAFMTIRQANTFRRESQRERITALVGELGHAAQLGVQGRPQVASVQPRLRAAIANHDMPKTLALAGPFERATSSTASPAPS